jgi:hypothetical protein
MHCRQYQTACSWMLTAETPTVSFKLRHGTGSSTATSDSDQTNSKISFYLMHSTHLIGYLNFRLFTENTGGNAMSSTAQASQSHMHLFAMAQLDVRRHET